MMTWERWKKGTKIRVAGDSSNVARRGMTGWVAEDADEHHVYAVFKATPTVFVWFSKRDLVRIPASETPTLPPGA